MFHFQIINFRWAKLCTMRMTVNKEAKSGELTQIHDVVSANGAVVNHYVCKSKAICCFGL